MPKIGNRFVRCLAALGVIAVVAVILGALGVLFIRAMDALGRLITGGDSIENVALGMLTIAVSFLSIFVLVFIVRFTDRLGNMLFDSAAATVEKKDTPQQLAEELLDLLPKEPKSVIECLCRSFISKAKLFQAQLNKTKKEERIEERSERQGTVVGLLEKITERMKK